MSYLEPIGYVYDYATYHPQCFPEGVDRDGAAVAAIFQWDADACETICDGCHEPLLECESNQPQQEDDDIKDLDLEGDAEGHPLSGGGRQPHTRKGGALYREYGGRSNGENTRSETHPAPTRLPDAQGPWQPLRLVASCPRAPADCVAGLGSRGRAPLSDRAGAQSARQKADRWLRQRSQGGANMARCLMQRGILTEAAARRLGVPECAHRIVKYDLRCLDERDYAVNIYYRQTYLGTTIIIGEDGILPCERELPDEQL